MGRSGKIWPLSLIYRKIKTYPGRMAWFIARLVGLQEEELPQALRDLEQEGYHVRQDEEGHLWAEDDDEQ